MPKLRTTNGDPGSLSSDEIVTTLLLESGVGNELPTNEGRVLDFLGLRQLSFDFMNELDLMPDNQAPPPESSGRTES